MFHFTEAAHPESCLLFQAVRSQYNVITLKFIQLTKPNRALSSRKRSVTISIWFVSYDMYYSVFVALFGGQSQCLMSVAATDRLLGAWHGQTSLSYRHKLM
eukprot:scaffold366006_cov20-Prasinocladus_malaysianus.AAC.1